MLLNKCSFVYFFAFINKTGLEILNILLHTLKHAALMKNLEANKCVFLFFFFFLALIIIVNQVNFQQKCMEIKSVKYNYQQNKLRIKPKIYIKKKILHPFNFFFFFFRSLFVD